MTSKIAAAFVALALTVGAAYGVSIHREDAQCNEALSVVYNAISEHREFAVCGK